MIKIVLFYSGAFRLYDLDGDGTITKKEMLKIVSAISAMTGQKDPKFTAESRVEKIFDSMDAVSIYMIKIFNKNKHFN